jgi:hypothetical protein
MKKFVIVKYLLIAVWTVNTAFCACKTGELSIYVSAVAFVDGMLVACMQMLIDQKRRNKIWHRE